MHAVLASVGALWLLLAWQPLRADAGQASLPPPELVRMLRSARIELDAGRLAPGLTALREAAEAFPQELAPVLELWNYHRRVGLPDDEASKLRALLTRRLADPDRELPPGMLKYLVENREAGEEELRLVLSATSARLAATPDDFELLQSVALLQDRLGMTDAARESSRRLLALEPSDELRWRCIDMEIEAERWEPAAELLEQLVNREEPSPWSRVLYITVMGKLGRHEELMRQLELLGATSPLSVMALKELLLEAAWDLRDADEHAEAERMFRLILEENPAHNEARTAILYFYATAEERQRHEQALAQRWSEEDNPVALMNEGADLLASGNATAAIELLERAVAALPDDEIAWFNLGVAAMRLERWERAAEALGQATRLNPRRAEAFYNRGAALRRIKRCQEAVADLERALELQPELNNAHFYLYKCYLALGDEETAQKHRTLIDFEE